MKRPPLTPRYGRNILKIIKERLERSPYPFVNVLLFGSCAQGKATLESDIDIAIICNPFDRSRVKETVAFYGLLRDLDTRIEIIVLHPDDLENRYSTIVQEVKRHGVAA